MWKLTRISSLQEMKSLASHPLRKNPQRMFGQQENENEREGKTEQGSVYSIYSYIYILIDIYYNGCKGIYIEKFFQPSQLRNLMVGGLQGEEWKFIQKYLKKRSKRVGAQISQFRTLHGDLRKFRKLISQLRIHFRTLRSKFASCKITFACWTSPQMHSCHPL